jgi:hypothetical protein
MYLEFYGKISVNNSLLTLSVIIWIIQVFSKLDVIEEKFPTLRLMHKLGAFHMELGWPG